MEKYKHKNWKLYVFLFTLVGQIICVFGESNISLIADHLGQVSVAAVIANKNWQPLISETWYYGWGFNWIFGVIFELSDNPYIIYMIIEVTFAVVNALGAYFFYITLEVLDCNSKNYIMYVAMAVAVGTTNGRGFGSTPTVFCLICVVIYTVAKLFLSSYSYKYSIMLAVEGIYSISLHERNMIFFVAISFCILLWLLIESKTRKYVYLVLLPYVATSTVLYVAFLLIKKIVIINVWNPTDGKIKGSTMLRGNMFWFTDDIGRSIKKFFECFFSNLYTLINNTWGVGIIFIVIFIVVLKNCSSKIFRKYDGEKNTSINVQNLIIMMLGITTILIMAGLAFDGARGVCSGNYNNYVNWTYHRYYLCYAYFGGFFCLVYIINNKINKSALFISSLIIYLILMIVFGKYQFPVLLSMQDKASRNLKSSFAWKIQTGSVNLNIKIALFILIVVLLFIKYNKFNLLGVLIFTFSIGALNIENLSLPYCESCGSIYSLYSKIGMEKLPSEIYTDSSSRYTLQFMLNDKTVKRGIPEENCKEAVYFSDSDSIDGLTDEYVQIQLDDNEWIFVKGESLIETIKEVLEENP